MKITIGLNINYSGYNNLGFVKTLDPFVINAECTEILALGIINYIEVEKIPAFLQHVVSKMRHGGKLTLTGKDIFHFAKLVMTQPGNIGLVEVNQMIYGPANQRPYASQVHVNYIADILQQLGLKIDRKSLDDGDFIIEATRP